MGHSIRALYRTCWLNNVAPRHRPLGCKIGLRSQPVNRTTSEVCMSLSLLLAVVSLVAWAVLTFGTPVSSGVIHLLLALGTTLLVRWWALRA
jgi:hypothetical protein